MSPAGADSASTTAGSDTLGVKLKVTTFWNFDGGRCAQGGYQLDHMTFKYTRTDGQFTASWNSGAMGVESIGCNAPAFQRSKTLSGPNTELLTPGTVYTRDFGTPSGWVIMAGGSVMDSWVHIDLHRVSQPNAGKLCAMAGPTIHNTAC